MTGGVPRLVNVVCDGALLLGYAREQAIIVEGSFTKWRRICG